MKKSLKVYIAGPYSRPDPDNNVWEAIHAGDRVRALGHIPFIPHLSHFWEKQKHHEYEFWMEYDMEWLKVCDCVLRLPGESSGADREVKWAQEHGLPILYSVEELK